VGFGLKDAQAGTSQEVVLLHCKSNLVMTAGNLQKGMKAKEKLLVNPLIPV